MSLIEEIRETSPTLKKYIFLNHASRAPLLDATKKAIERYMSCWEEFDFSPADNAMMEARENFAKLINATKEELAFIPNVIHGTKIAVNMLNYEKGDNIVCYWNDYVSQVYPALFLSKQKGIEYRPVQDQNNVITPEAFAEKIDSNTKIVLLSHVQWLTGFKADIEEIAKITHENEAYILVDTIQSTGALVNDVKRWNVDFLSCGVTKWLLGPSQAGFLYIRKELIDEFEPPFVGYYGVEFGTKDQPYWDTTKLEYVPTVEKFVDVNPKELLFSIANEGMKLILDYGIENVQQRVLKLSSYLIEQLSELQGVSFLTPLDPKYRSGIVNVRFPGASMDNVAITKKLREQKIITSSRYGGIRISPHFYNTEEDIITTVEKLKQLTK